MTLIILLLAVAMAGKTPVLPPIDLPDIDLIDEIEIEFPR